MIKQPTLLIVMGANTTPNTLEIVEKYKQLHNDVTVIVTDKSVFWETLVSRIPDLIYCIFDGEARELEQLFTDQLTKNLPEQYLTRLIKGKAEDLPENLYGILMKSMLSQPKAPQFSICTPTYNTKPEYLRRLYKSLCEQSLNDWEWVVYDQSPNSSVKKFIDVIIRYDPRVRFFRDQARQTPLAASLHKQNKEFPTNIGNSKAECFSLARGMFLIEMDHDDELLPSALRVLSNCIAKNPDVEFIFSDCFEFNQTQTATFPYPEGWGLHLGSHYKVTFKGLTFIVNDTPLMSNLSMRHIVSAPNHFRCWKREAYHKIGGHNKNLPIADDYEILVRTYIHLNCVKIQAPLYIQYYHETNSQDISRPLIQIYTKYISEYYNDQISSVVEKLNFKDQFKELSFEDKFNVLFHHPELATSVVPKSPRFWVLENAEEILAPEIEIFKD